MFWRLRLALSWRAERLIIVDCSVIIIKAGWFQSFRLRLYLKALFLFTYFIVLFEATNPLDSFVSRQTIFIWGILANIICFFNCFGWNFSKLIYIVFFLGSHLCSCMLKFFDDRTLCCCPSLLFDQLNTLFQPLLDLKGCRLALNCTRWWLLLPFLVRLSYKLRWRFQTLPERSWILLWFCQLRRIVLLRRQYRWLILLFGDFRRIQRWCHRSCAIPIKPRILLCHNLLISLSIIFGLLL